ncbi:hypothetical protein ACOMHN_018148 [Nucella lapillus]
MHQPAILGITELRPKRSRYDLQECELNIEGYELFHTLEQDGRGICLLIHKDLKPVVCDRVDTSAFREALFVECTTAGNSSLLVGLIYRSPSSSHENTSELNALLGKATEAATQDLLLIGDFNFPSIDWKQEISEVGPEQPATLFLKATQDAFLVQHQKDPTRYREGEKSNVLDLVFSNREELVEEITVSPGMGKSDHFTLFIKLNHSKSKPPEQKMFNFPKADFDRLRADLQETNWDSELTDLSVDEMWKVIKSKIENAVQQSVPLKSVGRARIKKWMDRKTLESVRKKHRLFRRWQQTQEIGDYTAYLKARNKASRECRKAKRNLEATVAAEAKNNPKVFWSYVKSKTTTRSGIGDLKKENGSKTTSDQEKAELLNNFFHSVFTHEDDGPLPDPPTAEYSTTLEDFEISEEKVLKLLQTLKIHKATGPDGINPLVLSKAADILAHPVTILFRKSLEDGQVPQDWRTATVSPIFKKGSRLQPCNYRPVSLTCILCKVMEKLIRENVIKHLDENVLISRQQHGFVQGRSCVTQLLDVMDAWTEILDAGGSVDIIYMDFMKAFDSVPHRRLLMKLAAYGIQGKVLDWTRAFLTDRQQSVVVNGAKSQTAPVTSGIPQGSVVGPMLFVVYINDLPNICVSEVKLFADDTKLYTRSDIPGATTALQADLDKLQQWSQDWLLRFHPQKCSVMKLGSKKSEVEYTMLDATQGTTVLEEHEHEKDLGVHVDNKLCFKEHVAKSTAKANKIVGIIRRTFDYLSNDLFAQLYKSLVRPILEYGHSVWQPHHKTLCSEVEDVQRRATKLLAPLRDKPYPERLMILGLPTLEHRRNRGDMIDLYKYMYGIYDSDRPKFEITKNRATRGNSLRIIKKHCRLDVRSGTFSQRVVNTWNDLPEFVVRAPSMNSFKGRLDAHWKNLASVHTPTCQS